MIRGIEEQLKKTQLQLANIKEDLIIEKVLFKNMKEILKKREEEISNLYNVINELINSDK